MYLNRRKNRLEYADYSEFKSYFVTICTRDREEYFGTIENNRMKLSPIGEIVNQKWRAIPGYFDDVKIDEYIIMPNHLHGIITFIDREHRSINERIRARLVSPPEPPLKRNLQKLPVIMGSLKSGVTREVNRMPEAAGFGWQKSYYDRIIRNRKELVLTREYIRNNPLKWDEDEDNRVNR